MVKIQLTPYTFFEIPDLVLVDPGTKIKVDLKVISRKDVTSDSRRTKLRLYPVISRVKK